MEQDKLAGLACVCARLAEPLTDSHHRACAAGLDLDAVWNVGPTSKGQDNENIVRAIQANIV